MLKKITIIVLLVIAIVGLAAIAAYILRRQESKEMRGDGRVWCESGKIIQEPFPHISNEAVVSLKEGASREILEKYLQEFDGFILDFLPEVNLYQIRFCKKIPVSEVINRLKEYPEVEEVAESGFLEPLAE